jgi:hypothetical protein
MDRSDRLALVFPARPAAARVAVSRDTALTLDDDAVLRGARDARNGAKFGRLWSGDTSGYPSASEADLALCSMLAFYTQDPVQIERLWLGSGLNPTARHGGNYRLRTIAKALDGNGVYTGTADPCAPIRNDFADFRAENARLRRMVAERDERIAALEARVMMFEKVQLRRAKILGNAALGPALVVAAALVQKIAWRVTATETPHAERGIPVPPGMMAMSVKEIAEAAGVNEGTAGKHLQLLADRGLIQRHIKSVYRTVDERTGEILDEPQYTSQHFFGPAEATALTADAPIALADAFASFTMERVENRGGKRIRRCPEHPTAEVVRIVVDRCAECRRELSPPVETVLPPMLLDPPDADPQDRSANFADHVLDHTHAVDDDVYMPRKIADRSPQKRDAGNPIANFADHSRSAARAVA